MRSGQRGAGDAAPSGWHGLEPGRGDRLAATLTLPVGAIAQPGDGRFDFGQGLGELAGQGSRLTAFGRDLARIGEVGVVLEPARVTEAQLGELVAQAFLLLFEERPVVDCRIGGGGVVRNRGRA
jgi:hypothetical protein